MINRSYFMHARKHRNDGSGGYSYRYIHFTVQSWLANDSEAFKYAEERLEQHMSDQPGDGIEITAFNRC